MDSRRQFLKVFAGSGELFHVTAATNRASNRSTGSTGRAQAAGAALYPAMEARSIASELDAMLLFEEDSTEFFADMPSEPSKVWTLDVTGRWVEHGPSGWYISRRRSRRRRPAPAAGRRVTLPAPTQSTTTYCSRASHMPGGLAREDQSGSWRQDWIPDPLPKR